MSYKPDSYDLDIIRNLWDGRTLYQEIAEKVGLTTNTVRNRVNKMIESGVLQIIALVNPAALEQHQSAYIGFKVLPQKVTEALKTVASLKNVVGCSSVSGRFDILGIFMFNGEYTYQRFVEEELKKVDGLLSTETFFVIGGDTFQLRYVL